VTHTHTHTHTHTRTRIRTRIRARARTHTHTHRTCTTARRGSWLSIAKFLKTPTRTQGEREIEPRERGREKEGERRTGEKGEREEGRKGGREGERDVTTPTLGTKSKGNREYKNTNI